MTLSTPNFSTITLDRCKTVSATSRLIWSQVFITGQCNASCKYCRRHGIDERDITIPEMEQVCKKFNGSKKIKLTGGEPTTHPNILELIVIAKQHGEEVSIGTNGLLKELALPLFKSGLTSATVSVDTPDDTKPLVFINVLAKRIRIVAGITVTNENISSLQDTIDAALSVGAHDVTISIGTNAKLSKDAFVGIRTYGKPILSFRVKKASQAATRGGCKHKCAMCLDSVCVKGGMHYPCQIYMREGGLPIGSIEDEMWRDKRLIWSELHDCGSDPICSKYCPDFCIEFNETVATLVK